MEIEITYEDYLNSGRKFMDPYTCPLATVMKRVLGRDDIGVGTTAIGSETGILGSVYPKFGMTAFEQLRDKKITFKTTFTPNEENTESAGSLQHSDSLSEASSGTQS